MKVISAMKTGSYTGKFGTMVKYAIQFEGQEEAVELSQKPETPAPKAGDELEGTIEDTQYGKRFKKAQGSFSKGGFSKSDPTSFYLSYGKDIVTAFITAGIIKDTKEAATQWTNFATLGKKLYDDLSAGHNPIKTPEKPVQSQTTYSARDDEPPMPEEREVDINEIDF